MIKSKKFFHYFVQLVNIKMFSLTSLNKVRKNLPREKILKSLRFFVLFQDFNVLVKVFLGIELGCEVLKERI